MKKLHEEWFDYARDDLAFAKAGLRDGFFSHVCVLSQQAVEKAMKGYLVYQDKSYPKDHGLIRLLKLMQVDWLDEHIGTLKKLSEYYVPLKYPDAAGALRGVSPDKKLAESSLNSAEGIVGLIESKTA
ncbi:MAG: HEPN domain-containing protein [Deltaproteobacteria bacterium]|nr:HEPN domain-containing protein [Deltaproteobacteria bacterium]MBI2499938.1 HEPN domain-containing protein [Deltaproteobacteria bacterium]